MEVIEYEEIILKYYYHCGHSWVYQFSFPTSFIRAYFQALPSTLENYIQDYPEVIGFEASGKDSDRTYSFKYGNRSCNNVRL